MNIETILESIDSVSSEILSLNDRRADLQDKLRGHTARRKSIEDEILDLRSKAALDEIADEESERLTLLQQDSNQLAADIKEVQRILKLNSDKISPLLAEKERYQQDLANARKIAATGEISELYDQMALEAAEALGRFAAMYTLKLGTPFSTLSPDKLVSMLVHASGSYHNEYQQAGGEQLSETRKRLNLETKVA